MPLLFALKLSHIWTPFSLFTFPFPFHYECNCTTFFPFYIHSWDVNCKCSPHHFPTFFTPSFDFYTLGESILKKSHLWREMKWDIFRRFYPVCFEWMGTLMNLMFYFQTSTQACKERRSMQSTEEFWSRKQFDSRDNSGGGGNNIEQWLIARQRIGKHNNDLNECIWKRGNTTLLSCPSRNIVKQKCH